MLREANLGDDLSLEHKNVVRRRETAFAAAAARTVFLPAKRCILVVGGTRKSVYKCRAYKNGRSDIFEHFFIWNLNYAVDFNDISQTFVEFI